MRWPLALLVLAACSSPSPEFSSTSSSRSASPTITSSMTTSVTTTSVTTSAPDATTTRDPAPTNSPTTEPPEERGVVPAGFDRGAAIVTKPDGSTCEVCVWLATNASSRARGLMGVTDLGEADAMAFVYPEAHTGSFWMRNTPLPLSIAFFAPDGSYLDAFDMEPCVTETCISYPTPADFLVAVEVPQGGLDELGMTPGSTLRLLDRPCLDT